MALTYSAVMADRWRSRAAIESLVWGLADATVERVHALAKRADAHVALVYLPLQEGQLVEPLLGLLSVQGYFALGFAYLAGVAALGLLHFGCGARFAAFFLSGGTVGALAALFAGLAAAAPFAGCGLLLFRAGFLLGGLFGRHTELPGGAFHCGAAQHHHDQQPFSYDCTDAIQRLFLL